MPRNIDCTIRLVGYCDPGEGDINSRFWRAMPCTISTKMFPLTDCPSSILQVNVAAMSLMSVELLFGRAGLLALEVTTMMLLPSSKSNCAVKAFVVKMGSSWQVMLAMTGLPSSGSVSYAPTPCRYI